MTQPPGHLPELHDRVLEWYAANRRDLPWREPGCSAYGVLVSEVMLQQTQVARVLPRWLAWMQQWPDAASLAAAPVADVLRAWDRLGYPRRALRLHAAAQAVVERHGGAVPSDLAELRALPGVGTYTAAAVAAFAYAAHTAVLDTNVRRVLARVVGGQEQAPPSLGRAETAWAESLLPDPDRSPEWNVALMELGALVCTAQRPACAACPVADLCAWQLAGGATYAGPRRKSQAWAGTDRRCRGAIMARLRAADAPVPVSDLADTGTDAAQVARCVTGLVHDGLAQQVSPGPALQLPRSGAGPGSSPPQ